MLIRRLAACSLVLAAVGSSHAQPQLGTNEVVFKSGEWSVVRSTRSRSDTVSCTAFYKDERDVQLGADQLIIKVAPGLRQIVVRHGDDLSQPPRAPTAAEKQLNAVVFSGENFKQALAARKLAVEVTTRDTRRAILLRMKGSAEVLANIKAGCPVPVKAAPPMCSETLRGRMRENGVSAAQIDRICR